MQDFDQFSDSNNPDIAFAEGFLNALCYIASQSNDAEYKALKDRITTPLSFNEHSRRKTYERFGMVYIALVEELARVGFFLSIAARFEAITSGKDVKVSHELFTLCLLNVVKEHLAIGLENKDKMADAEAVIESIKAKKREVRRETQV